MDILEGYRTKLFGWITALTGVMNEIGFENYDPDAIIAWITSGNELIVTAYLALGAAIHHFRNKAGDSA